MKVVYVAREMISPPIEGHHIISKRIIESAIRAGVNQHTITIEPFVKEEESSGAITVINSKYYADNTGENAVVSAVTRVANEFVSSVNVASQIKSNPFDLVHVLNFTKEAYMITHKLLRINKPLIVHFYHSPYVLTDDVFVIRNLAFRIGLYGRLLGNTVLSVNRSLVEFLVSRLGADPERVHFVPCPIDTSVFRPISARKSLREKYGLPLDKPIVVYVGSLNSARGIIELITSFKSVLSQIPEAMFYISYPQHKTEGTYEAEVLERIRSLKLQKNVIMSGPSQNVEEIYNLADVMVLPFNRPYWIDPPLVVLEAMSCGVPIITTSVGAIGEVAKDNDNALIVDPGDIDALSESIVGLINNKAEASKIGKNARETIIRNNSYEIVGERLLKIYSSLVD
jgi:glycosyltransferase involved in cell wall biosynthesis